MTRRVIALLTARHNMDEKPIEFGDIRSAIQRCVEDPERLDPAGSLTEQGDRLVENALQSEMFANMQRLEKANPVPEYLLAALTGQLPEPSSIDIPTMGIWSERDEFLWESQMKNSGKYISAEWQYTRIEQAGHWFMLEQPDKTNQLLLSWLAKHS